MNAANEFLELPCEYRTHNVHSKWRLRDESWDAVADAAAEKIFRPEKIPANDLLKQARRRLVFRLQADHPQAAQVLVKAFPLDSLKHRLEHKKYAFSEAANLLHAARLNLPVPKVFAFGDARKFGLVRWTAACEEFINGKPMSYQFAASRDPQLHRRLLERTLPLFKKIYEAACNHIDFGPHAILIPEKSGEPDRIIDFQYCRFLPQPGKATLAAQAGYFGWCVITNRTWVEKKIVEDWFETLLDFLNFDKRDALRKIFRDRLPARASIKDRLAARWEIPK